MRNDLDSLLNSVFGSSKTRPTAFGTAAQQTEDLLAEVERVNQRISSELKRQTEALSEKRPVPASADRLCGDARRDVAALQSRLEQDGLVQPSARKNPYLENPGIFSEIEEGAKRVVFGQDEFLHRFVLAMKRPFATGHDEGKAENAILVCGGAHTGRHTAVGCVLGLMQEKELLPAGEAAVIDLSRYAAPSDETLFLQDLYSALLQKSPVLIFDRIETCLPAFAQTLCSLARTGEHRLSSRYLMQNGRLIDAGGALAANPVSSVSAADKFLIFISTLKPSKIIDRFGTAFLSAFGDVCETSALTPEALRLIADAQAKALCRQAKDRLGMALSCGGSVADRLFAAAEPDSGAKKIVEARQEVFSALTQWKLENDPGQNAAVSLNASPGWSAAVGESTFDLSPYLPQAYRGALDEVRRELDMIVGLHEVKDYVLSLEDHYRVQARRRAEGMKTAAVSMHMIFTGNPGTGKTTIARIISRYLKAIGVLSGGQLVEVSRADLVGRYVGHTAPLTKNVIESALGGVLFIDEAYSLYRGKDDSFGLEAIDTLVKGIEDNRENLVVILAGYSREMKEFLTSNSGLRSRFPNIIEFPDYTGEELLRITEINASQRGYRLSDGVSGALLEYYTRVQAENSRESGNGRLARNKLEEAIVNQSRRLIAEPDSPLDELRLGDFEL